VRRNIPILPVTVNGSRRILPKGSLVVRPGKIQVVVGKPIDAGAYTLELVDNLIDETRRVVIANFDPGYAGRFLA